jgi:ferric-dicitrate binding protein FerR (iron transport regulator)
MQKKATFISLKRKNNTFLLADLILRVFSIYKLNKMNEQVEKYFLGMMDIHERIDFLRKLESDEELQAEYSRYQAIDLLLALSGDAGNGLESVRSYSAFARRMKQKTLYRYVLRAAGYAAAVLLLVLPVHFYHIHHDPKPFVAASEVSLFVPAGQRLCLTLSDGTIVWLNARSRLVYPAAFTGSERRVSIEGEAYFEVAKNEDMPFIVSLQDVEVKVLGTDFNIYNYPGEDPVRVSLLEGSLLVYDKSSPDQSMTLRPREEAVFRNHRMIRESIPDNDPFLWKDGIYSFEEETLGHIFRKLELYYDITIEVGNPAILEWKYTVKFRQRDGIDEILRLLSRVHPFRIRKDHENNRIVISK